MRDYLKELLDLLRLEPLEADRFRGQSQDLGWGRVFGGQVIGQAMVAATNTIEGRPVHSMHAYFLRPGDVEHPIDYVVERVRDGGSFSVRRVVAHQLGKPIFEMSASFQAPEEGFEHQFPMPDIAGPEGLTSELDLARAIRQSLPERMHELYLCDRPIEVRPIDPVNPYKPEAKPPYKYSWIRAVGEMPDDPTLHKCLLAYASDWGFVHTSTRPHGVTFMTQGMQTASLDHAMWFHRDFRMDQWLLYAQDSPSASHGRGFNRGNIYTADGTLVVSVCQEALIRKRGA
jgi:acyl-CoA thioesterase-2